MKNSLSPGLWRGVPQVIRNTHSPRITIRSLGIGLLKGPTGGGGLMSEVPLYLAVTIASGAGLPLLPFRDTRSKTEFVIDNLLVRIHFIIQMILVDRPCAMGVSIPFSRQPYIYLSIPI
jgi:hypothetical protein